MPFSFAAKAFGIAKCRPLRRGLPLRSMCGRNLRFPHTRPSLFVIPYSLGSKRTAPATGRGLEPNCAPGFFFAPNQRPRSSRSEPSRIKEGTRGCLLLLCTTGFPKTALPEPVPQSGTPQLFSIHLSRPGLPVPLPGKSRKPLPAGAGDQFPGSNAGLQNALSPRTAPHAGHRLILNPCRRAAHRNYSLFTLLYSLSQPCPAPFSLRDGQQNKNIFCFLVT